MPATILDSTFKPLAGSGRTWAERGAVEQRPLLRALSLTSNMVERRSSGLAAACGHLLDNSGRSLIHSPWSFSSSDVRWQRAGSAGLLSPVIGADGDTFATLSDGSTIRLPAGYREEGTDGALAFYSLRADGREVIVIQGDVLSFVTQYTDIPVLALADSQEYLVLTLDEALVEQILTSRGDAVLLALNPESSWYLRCPNDLRPELLVHRNGFLTEGTGFRRYYGFIELRTNPYELWPDGVVTCFGRPAFPRNPRSSGLGADLLTSSDGGKIASYRKYGQDLASFQAALAQAAGIPVVETGGTVVRIDTLPGGYAYWTGGGERVFVPGDLLYLIGDTLEAGQTIIEVRSSLTHGADWWRGRQWAVDGVDISVFFPGFSGISIKDERRPAYTTGTGDDLRARIDFGQDEELEDEFWTWQHTTEGEFGTASFATDVLGLAEGEGGTVNVMEVLVSMLGEWFIVVENDLRIREERLWMALRDFAARERPAGAIVHVQETLPVAASDSLASAGS